MQVGTAMVIRAGVNTGVQVLLGLRKDSGLLELPGGKVEKYEHPSEAAVRETKEEVGINLRREAGKSLWNGQWPELQTIGAFPAIGRSDDWWLTIGFKVEMIHHPTVKNNEPDKYHWWKWFYLNSINEPVTGDLKLNPITMALIKENKAAQDSMWLTDD